MEAPSALPAVIMPNPMVTNPSDYTVTIPGLQGAINMATNILQPSQLQQPDIVVPTVVQRELPPGWIMMFTNEGLPYYLHQPTGAIQYHDPSGATVDPNDHCRHGGNSNAVVGDP